jgi:hypothetical protein
MDAGRNTDWSGHIGQDDGCFPAISGQAAPLFERRSVLRKHGGCGSDLRRVEPTVAIDQQIYFDSVT